MYSLQFIYKVRLHRFHKRKNYWQRTIVTLIAEGQMSAEHEALQDVVAKTGPGWEVTGILCKKVVPNSTVSNSYGIGRRCAM